MLAKERTTQVQFAEAANNIAEICLDEKSFAEYDSLTFDDCDSSTANEKLSCQENQPSYQNTQVGEIVISDKQPFATDHVDVDKHDDEVNKYLKTDYLSRSLTSETPMPINLHFPAKTT